MRMGRRAENSPLFVLQHLQPVVEIAGVVLPRRRRDSQVAAQERGPDLGHEFFSGIGGITPAFLTEVTIKVMPKPETACTIVLHGLADDVADCAPGLRLDSRMAVPSR